MTWKWWIRAALSVADVRSCMMDPELDADNDLLKKEQDAQVCNILNQPFKSLSYH